MANERTTWLRYEVMQVLEDYQRGELDAHAVVEHSTRLVSQSEVDTLGDELLQQSYWTMQHLGHRPACWAPKRGEIDYLISCLRDEDIFDPEQIEVIRNAHE